MTTLIPVAISDTNAPPWTGQVTLDGQAYTVNILWNLHGQRYYLQIVNGSGSTVLFTPLIGSPLDFSIDLVYGLFASTLVYRADTGNLETNP